MTTNRKKTTEIVVFMTRSEPSCDFCGEDLGRGAWIRTIEHQARYDELLATGWFRDEARAEVRNEIDAVADRWARRTG